MQNMDLLDEELLAEKTEVVLVLLNRDLLEEAVKSLNFDNVNLTAIVIERDLAEPVPQFKDPMFYRLGEEQIPMKLFADIRLPLRDFKTAVWLICGCMNDKDEFLKMKNFLMMSGVSQSNIIKLELDSQISATWLANLHYIEEHGADYFVTGNEFIQADLNMNLIPIGARGVNLADTNQTLRQGCLTAKYVFSHVAPGTIKFVLIGLNPDSFRCDDDKNFLNCTQNLRYAAALNDMSACDEPMTNLFNDDFKNIFATVIDEPDLNFDGIKGNFNSTFSAEAISVLEDAPQIFSPDAFDDSIQLLNYYLEIKNYIELCLANGAKPVGVIFPFAPAVRKNYEPKFLAAFQKMILRLEENYDFLCVNMFELNLNYDCFCDLTHLNARGQSFANALISLKLYVNNIIPAENFCTMNYAHFHNLSVHAPKDDYNVLMADVFKASVAKIRRKDKIKVGFVIYEPTQWFGSELYDLFSRDKRFDVTFILCTPILGLKGNELFEKDFIQGVQQISSHVSTIFVPEGRSAPVPPQDVLILFTPFPSTLPLALRAENLTPETLVAHIPYAFDISLRTKGYYNRRMFAVAWKIFFSSVSALEVYDEQNSVGMPRGFFSGYPRMDFFFKRDVPFHFDWKMIRPDAKKIIWAPHWSVTRDVNYATFQWNFEFMYQFAKAHPETSWIFKPHPRLFDEAIREKIFPSVAAFKEYLQAWNDLPNAQVVIGAYYQAIFATSDGLIHDSDTFIAEYQYVDKPMIFLKRDTQRHNKLGEEILGVSYCVDGQDLDGIAATIQRVFIDGDDYKSAARRTVFNKYLNYPQANGMLASEFIYRSITDEFKSSSE